MFNLNDYRLNESRVFRDPIHGYITVEYLPIWHLIKTKEFQRLRRIKQLGGAYMVFPGAEQSRFTHSLGVYEIVRHMIDLDEIKHQLNDYEKLTVLIAGLLHDVGHGPFSHSFEDTFSDVSHEVMTNRIITGNTEIHTVLQSISPTLASDVASVIDHTHPNDILKQIVSSQLDADRMDYLLRDSYMAGVTYGEFDKERILRTLRIKDHRIVFKKSGVQAIEDYILARYHMYWQVYYHPTITSYELLLKSIAHRLIDLYKEGYQFHTDIKYLLPFIKNDFKVEDYIQLDEPTMIHYYKELCMESDPILSDLCTRFINRRLFKYQNIREHTLTYYQEKSESIGYVPKYYVFEERLTQIPYHNDVSKVNEIEILGEDGQIHTLPEHSEIVNAIINGEIKRDDKVYCVKEVFNEK